MLYGIIYIAPNRHHLATSTAPSNETVSTTPAPMEFASGDKSTAAAYYTIHGPMSWTVTVLLALCGLLFKF